MILNFSTTINGKPTYFVEKIWMSLRPFSPAEYLVKMDSLDLSPYFLKKHFKPKIHTIRQDKHNRWKKDMRIDFYINSRTKSAFCFAPFLAVKRVQIIEIIENDIFIDDRQLALFEIQKLAKNDGFDSVADFYDYFGSNYTGKIIHWTDFKY